MGGGIKAKRRETEKSGNYKRGRERRLQEGRRCTQALDIDAAPPLLVVDLV